jgi:hypothetical protein
VFGLLLGGAFAVVVLAYVLTEYLLARLDVRRRVFVRDGSPLVPILYANAVSFLVIGISSVVMLFTFSFDLYAGHAVLLCLCAQAVWLGQHLWSYYRDHPRLGY